MTAIQALALYAGLNILILIVLAINVSRNRRRAKISLGTGKDRALEQACRAHGNTAENLPIALLGLVILVMLGTEPVYIHVLGAAIVISRLLYAQGVLTSYGPSFGRLAGTGLSWFGFLATAALCLMAAFS
jgi:uncharacterized membrane protein YecN with MAPEG domain